MILIDKKETSLKTERWDPAGENKFGEISQIYMCKGGKRAVLEYHAASIGVCFFPFLFEKQHGNCRQYCNEIIVGKKLSSFVAEIIAHPSITTSKNIDKYVPYNFNTIYFLANSLLWSHI